MNIDTRVEPLEGRLPTVEWRWDVETDILSGGFRASLEHGRSRGLMAARRQAIECAKQAEAWSGFAGGRRVS